MKIPTPADVHELAVSKGWYDTPRDVPELLCLIHSEISEALEEYRNPETTANYIYYRKDGKPEGLGVELADAIIRIFDMCDFLQIDIVRCLNEKHAYNQGREYRHGGKVC